MFGSRFGLVQADEGVGVVRLVVVVRLRYSVRDELRVVLAGTVLAVLLGFGGHLTNVSDLKLKKRRLKLFNSIYQLFKIAMKNFRIMKTSLLKT
jgi:hypothetical protein